jgi:20S proteasome alpha/beta subunit
MTLIVAIPAEDGVVFGSDTQVTTGSVRASATKIFPFGGHTLWGASGELAVIQRVAESMEGIANKDESLAALRDPLSHIVRDAVQTLLGLDFRTQFVGQDPNALLGLHPADFLFVECRDTPRVLHVLSTGISEWVEGRFTATGNGDLFAHALLAKYARARLSCDHAKLLAFKVIEEAIQVGAYGLGPPIDIWEVTESGPRQATAEEIAGLEDSARLLREQEVEMLAGGPEHVEPEISESGVLAPDVEEVTQADEATTSRGDR